MAIYIILQTKVAHISELQCNCRLEEGEEESKLWLRYTPDERSRCSCSTRRLWLSINPQIHRATSDSAAARKDLRQLLWRGGEAEGYCTLMVRWKWRRYFDIAAELGDFATAAILWVQQRQCVLLCRFLLSVPGMGGRYFHSHWRSPLFQLFCICSHLVITYSTSFRYPGEGNAKNSDFCICRDIVGK